MTLYKRNCNKIICKGKAEKLPLFTDLKNSLNCAS